MKLQIPKTAAIVVGFLVVIVGSYFLLRGRFQAPTVVPTKPVAPREEGFGPTGPRPATKAPGTEVKEVTVLGTEYAFEPATISLKAGEEVKLAFQNKGRIAHNLIIEGLGVGTATIGGGQEEVIEFTAPASGTYRFFCSVPGHRAAGMVGTLKVE